VEPRLVPVCNPVADAPSAAPGGGRLVAALSLPHRGSDFSRPRLNFSLAELLQLTPSRLVHDVPRQPEDSSSSESVERSGGFVSVVGRTPGISCEAVPASERTGAGMRRHLRPSAACGARVGAAESFVSFIPLFDSLPAIQSSSCRGGPFSRNFDTACEKP
jgi:hypothetical protein